MAARFEEELRSLTGNPFNHKRCWQVACQIGLLREMGMTAEADVIARALASIGWRE